MSTRQNNHGSQGLVHSCLRWPHLEMSAAIGYTHLSDEMLFRVANGVGRLLKRWRRFLDFDPKWYKLDNVAKVYPAVENAKDSCVYRLTVNLAQDVDKDCLQRAAIDCKPRFPCMYVKLRHGYHWSYFEPNEKLPVVRPEPPFVNRRMVPHRNNEYLFSVFYYNNRISVEVFHGLSDGYGGMEFLKAILFRYFQLLGYPVQNDGQILSVEQAPDEAETEDSFEKHRSLEGKKRRRVKYAYRQKGARLPASFGTGVTCGKFKTADLLRVAQSRGATITEYLTALLTYSLWQADDRAKSSGKPINICVPVNMRRFFPSKTLRNFSLVFHTTMDCETKNLSFAETLETVKASFKSGIDREKFQKTLNTMVNSGRHPILRTAPLPIKNMALLIGRSIFGDRLRSGTLSNLGTVSMPDSLREHIRDFEVYMPAGRNALSSVGVISFEDTMTVCFSRSLRDGALEKCFFAWLADQGVAVDIQSNIPQGAPEHPGLRPSGQTYPEYILGGGDSGDNGKWRKFAKTVSILSAALIGASVAANIATWNGNLWCAIFSVIVLYVWLMGIVTLKKGLHSGMKLTAHAISIPVLLTVINLFAYDDATVNHVSWAVSYATPIVFVCFILAINVIMLKLKHQFRDYLLYQISLCVIGFVPLVLVLSGVAQPIYPSIFAAACSYLTIIGLIFFKRRVVFSEFQKKFHI